MSTILPLSQGPGQLSPADRALRDVARELEASFLAEMLKSAGLGKTSGPFTGGEGEEQFASFLVDEHARQIVKAGGLGLAESIFHSLKEKQK